MPQEGILVTFSLKVIANISLMGEGGHSLFSDFFKIPYCFFFCCSLCFIYSLCFLFLLDDRINDSELSFSILDKKLLVS